MRITSANPATAADCTAPPSPNGRTGGLQVRQIVP